MSSIICYRNLLDLPTSVLSLSSGAPVSGFPLDNLKTRQLARSTRIPTAGLPMIVVDLGAVTTLDLIGLIGINSTVRAADDVVVQYSNNGTGWVQAYGVCPNDAGAPDLPRSVLVRPRQVPGFGGSKLTARYLRIQPRWATADAWREIGRLYIADAIDLVDGSDAGWTLGSRDYGVLDRSSGLQYYADRRTRGRTLTMPLTNVGTDIAFGFLDTATVGGNAPSLDDLINYAGVTGDVIVAPRADSPLWLRRTGIYGHLTEDSLAIRHNAVHSGASYEITVRVEEER